MPTYHIQSYGCQMNTTESEEMAGICEALGLVQADSYKTADVVILNSCSVRQAAEDKVYGWGKKIKKTGKRIFGAPLSELATPSADNTWARLNTNAGEFHDQYAKTREKVLSKYGYGQAKADLANRHPGLDPGSRGEGMNAISDAQLSDGARQVRDGEKGRQIEDEKTFPLMILTGCMVGSARGQRQRVGEKDLAQRARFVDYFMDQGDYERQLPFILLREGMAASTPRVESHKVEPSHSTGQESIKRARRNLGEGGSVQQETIPIIPNAALIAKRARGEHAFVKISEGCDNYCTFCVVPYARGEERHKSEEHILSEIQLLVSRGYTHITLLGQNVNSWGIAGRKQKRAIRIGSDQKLPFAALLRAIHAIPDIQKISFITSNPFDFTRDMVEVLALPKIDRYLHMAVQSGSDSVLRRMARRHTIAEFTQLVSDIRATVPDIHLGTDLIVGFSGETEEEFADTLRLVESIRFDVAYMAMYSERVGTAAEGKLPDDVSRAVKHERYQRLVELVEKVKAQNKS